MQKIHKVLFIDDSRDDNYFHKRVLKKMGCVELVDTCFDGIDALDYLQGAGAYADRDETFEAPNIIFLDINMPRMDGWEFLDAYQTLNFHPPKAPIIVMLSTSINPSDKECALANTYLSGFCTKPLTQTAAQEIFDKYFQEKLSN